MAQEKKFFDRRETTTGLETMPKFKVWWDRNVLTKWRKFQKWFNKPQNQRTAFTWVVLIALGMIVFSALCGNVNDTKIVNTVFRFAIFIDVLAILRELKSIREALMCILLIVAIAAVLQYLGLSSPEWLVKLWDFLKDPDFVDLYKSIITWLFGEYRNFFPW